MATEPSFIRGKGVVITGGTTGLGVGISQRLVECGASTLFVICRNPAKGEALKRDILADQLLTTDIRLVIADLSSQREARAAAREIALSGIPIQLLFLNAATFARGGALHRTEEGIEESLAVNVLSLMVIFEELLPELAKAHAARVVVTGDSPRSVQPFRDSDKPYSDCVLQAPTHPMGLNPHGRSTSITSRAKAGWASRDSAIMVFKPVAHNPTANNHPPTHNVPHSHSAHEAHEPVLGPGSGRPPPDRAPKRDHQLLPSRCVSAMLVWRWS